MSSFSTVAVGSRLFPGFPSSFRVLDIGSRPRVQIIRVQSEHLRDELVEGIPVFPGRLFDRMTSQYSFLVRQWTFSLQWIRKLDASGSMTPLQAGW